MSRIGKKPVALPSGVTVTVSGSSVVVKGPKGEMEYQTLPEVSVKADGSTVQVDRKDDSMAARARHGLTRMLIQNMATGVSTGYEKQLEIIGVGYKAQVKGKILVLNLGHSHPINFSIPEGIEIVPNEKNKNIIAIRGISKQLVGQVSSDIRGLRPPEPYKGKGVRYVGEHVRRKAGKAAVAKAA
ncbi:50S ribosomal protein L6 [Candidatus Peregrinibacteria bacterium]|nr:50S ribosomal protein L6 [Candidatus Peregrinibacteria bacterium]